jgi:hypothetical protein
MDLGDKKISCRQANPRGAAAAAAAAPRLAQSSQNQQQLGSYTNTALALPTGAAGSIDVNLLLNAALGGSLATRVLVLDNMVTEEELKDPAEYSDLCEDIQEECSKLGKLVSSQIPQPGYAGAASAIGRVYLEYETKEEAETALRSLSGRKFGSNAIAANFYDVEKYTGGMYE